MTEYYFEERFFGDEEEDEQYDANGGVLSESDQGGSPSRGDHDRDSVSSSGSSFFMDQYSSSHSHVKDVKKSEWMQILKKSQKLHRFTTIAPQTNGAEMFNILWEPALSILQFHLRFARHPKVLDRVVQV